MHADEGLPRHRAAAEGIVAGVQEGRVAVGRPLVCTEKGRCGEATAVKESDAGSSTCIEEEGEKPWAYRRHYGYFQHMHREEERNCGVPGGVVEAGGVCGGACHALKARGVKGRSPTSQGAEGKRGAWGAETVHSKEGGCIGVGLLCSGGERVVTGTDTSCRGVEPGRQGACV